MVPRTCSTGHERARCSPFWRPPRAPVGRRSIGPVSRTQYYCAASLDGYIAEADDTLDWLLSYDGSFSGPHAEPIKSSYDRFYEDVGALVMGSVTYEFVLALDRGWPYEGKPTWVLSSRVLP